MRRRMMMMLMMTKKMMVMMMMMMMTPLATTIMTTNHFTYLVLWAVLECIRELDPGPPGRAQEGRVVELGMRALQVPQPQPVAPHDLRERPAVVSKAETVSHAT
jgi:hypothetical protein